jgi:hypothetical protein
MGAVVSLAKIDPGKDRPANALVPAQPGKAAGGSSQAPPSTLSDLPEILKPSCAPMRGMLVGAIHPAASGKTRQRASQGKTCTCAQNRQLAGQAANLPLEGTEAESSWLKGRHRIVAKLAESCP